MKTTLILGYVILMSLGVTAQSGDSLNVVTNNSSCTLNLTYFTNDGSTMNPCLTTCSGMISIPPFFTRMIGMSCVNEKVVRLIMEDPNIPDTCSFSVCNNPFPWSCSISSGCVSGQFNFHSVPQPLQARQLNWI